MALEPGDRGEPVKDLQRGLNRLGSLLLIDGDFGPTTQAAVVDACVALKRPGPPEADDTLVATLARLPEPSADLTAPGVAYIGRLEVSSPAQYRAVYKHPQWPTLESGITIGIGYDLSAVSAAALRADWSNVLPAATVERLVGVIGAGSDKRLAAVADIEIPLIDAVAVYVKRMVPRYVAETRIAYPTLDALPPAHRTALISLVFNRGRALDGPRRAEMQRIRELLAAGELDAVPAQFESMTRLWTTPKDRGVAERRRNEAKLWREGFVALQLA